MEWFGSLKVKNLSLLTGIRHSSFLPRVTKWIGLKNDFVVVVLDLVLCRHFLKFDVFRQDFSMMKFEVFWQDLEWRNSVRYYIGILHFIMENSTYFDTIWWQKLALFWHVLTLNKVINGSSWSWQGLKCIEKILQVQPK